MKSTYTDHANEHGAFLVRPLKPNYISDIKEITNAHVNPFIEILTKNDEGCFIFDQVIDEKKWISYNTFRKEANDADFERSPGYDLGGRSTFWPSMLPFLSNLSE